MILKCILYPKNLLTQERTYECIKSIISRKNNRILLLLFCFIVCSFSLTAQTVVKKIDNKWTLYVDGKPFEIKGATFGYDSDTKNYDRYFKDLNFLGVNSIRIWATNENTQQLLDAAHSHNIKVMVGIWMRHGRPGMEDDDRFNYLKDIEGMEAMYKNAITTVKKYKDHPAVLTWAIGNEVYLNMATDPEKEAYSKLLQRICSSIKKVDPNHPITSVEAWTFGLKWWQNFVPSIDIYGLNSYGPGAGLLSDELKKRNIDKPYIITEFGVTGEWDIKEQKNDIKVEPNDQQKYEAIVYGYNEWIKNKPANLGAYVFHYANGNDFLSSWLLSHYKGMYRPQYWGIREAYTGKKPTNRVPEITTFSVPDKMVASEKWVPVTLAVSDFENETLEISFYYNQRTGSRKRRDQINKLNYRGNQNDGFQIQLPKEDGPIKLYVHAKDTYNNLGIASTSILVKDENARKKKFLVPKVNLPFYVYKDGKENPYFASAYMGNYSEMKVDLLDKSDPHSGESALKISYKADYNWYGLGLVDPANDWGDILGGYDISGAKKFSFWAKASKKGVIVKIGFGMISITKPYPDTAKKTVEVKLSTKWKKYTIKTKKLDLSCIRSGLVIFSTSYGAPQDIYLDDVVFE